MIFLARCYSFRAGTRRGAFKSRHALGILAACQRSRAAKLFFSLCRPTRFGKERALKTRKASGVDCGAECFAYVGDPEEPKTWLFCVRVLGDTGKSVNAIKTALHHFADTKGIPDSERQTVWLMIVGAAKAHGIPAQKEAPAKSEPKTPVQSLDAEDAQLKESLALAALHRDKFLHSIGYGDT